MGKELAERLATRWHGRSFLKYPRYIHQPAFSLGSDKRQTSTDQISLPAQKQKKPLDECWANTSLMKNVPAIRCGLFFSPAAIVIMCTWMWFLYQTNTSVKAFIKEQLCIDRTKQTRLAPIQQLLLLLSLQKWKECVWIQNFRGVGGVNPVCRKTKGPSPNLPVAQCVMADNERVVCQRQRRGAGSAGLSLGFNRASAQSETWAMQTVLKRNNVWESNLILQQVVRTVSNIIVSRFRFFLMQKA